METKDIVQEYAQTQAQPTVAESTTVENTNTESSLNETPAQEVSSIAPETPANNSAYEALLSGKSNVTDEPKQNLHNKMCNLYKNLYKNLYNQMYNQS